jgi:hypothetical protein
MSEVPMSPRDLQHAGAKSLWPLAAVILGLVFAPAIVAWVVELIR